MMQPIDSQYGKPGFVVPGQEGVDLEIEQGGGVQEVTPGDNEEEEK